MKPVVMGDNEDEFECREKLLIGFCNFPTNRNLMKRTKSTSFRLNTPLQVLFWIEFLMEELELVVAEEHKFEKSAK